MLSHILHDVCAAGLGLCLGWLAISCIFGKKLTFRIIDLLLVCVAAGIAFSHSDWVVGSMALCGIVTRCILGIDEQDEQLRINRG